MPTITNFGDVVTTGTSYTSGALSGGATITAATGFSGPVYTGGSFAGTTFTATTGFSAPAFTGGTFVGGTVSGTTFTAGTGFSGPAHTGGTFAGTTFTATTGFSGPAFTGGTFVGGTVSGTTITAGTGFSGPAITGGTFAGTTFTATTGFSGPAFTGGTFVGGTVSGTTFTAGTGFSGPAHTGGTFAGTTFTATTGFSGPAFTGGTFAGTTFTATTGFSGPAFTGGTITGGITRITATPVAAANVLTVIGSSTTGNVVQFSNSAAGTFILTNAGYVGIGTITPVAPLSTFFANSGLPDTTGSGTANVASRFQVSSVCLDMGNAISGAMWLQNHALTTWATTYPLLLNPNGGGVGIGTSGAPYPLTVAGVGAVIIATNPVQALSTVVGASSVAYTGSQTNHQYWIVTNGGAGGNIVMDTSGNFAPSTTGTLDLGGAGNRWRTIYSVNALNTSDRNLKTNIQDAPLGLDFVNALKPRTFTWKENTQIVKNPVTEEDQTIVTPAGTRLQYGLIAQEVKDVLDSFNINSKDFAGYVDSTINEPEKPQTLYLNYIQFIPVLIKSIQELSSENKELKTRLDALEARLAAAGF